MTGEGIAIGQYRARGATYDGRGTNFAVWAPSAEQVWVCLYDEGGAETRIELPGRTFGVWHGYLPGVEPGQRYGFRASGPWSPSAGLLFNQDKLLLDPYARAVDGEVTPSPALRPGRDDGTPNPGDSAALVPRSIVIADDGFDWDGDTQLHTPWRRTVIYEAHVKGLTQRLPGIPDGLRGSFAGIGHPACLHYLRDLGITALELLPVHHFVTEAELIARGLVNYWGYNTLGFFAPHAAYSSSGARGEQVVEFKQMVKALHAAGIEVILDVVYNHTAEGGPDGPALCFRGLADHAYYLGSSEGAYVDVTGCGNTVDVSNRQVLQLVMDSLRYWATEMHVDGFRFDLAPALCRTGGKVDLEAAFLLAVHQDPVLREMKLIAEPWDTTHEGYLLGQFPSPWCEWNGRFRDDVRDFWRGRSNGVRDLASRMAGSSDVFGLVDRVPFASVNLITAHDGLTLRDLVSYDSKHNEANGEGGRDGTDDDRSCNHGAEGDTDDPSIRELRVRQAANMLTTVLLASGVPMITAGDERGRTQLGNNNAYCHDDDTTWLSFAEPPEWQQLHDLVRRLVRLRADHPVLRQRAFFDGAPRPHALEKDISWLRPDGAEMTSTDWDDDGARTLGMLLSGEAVQDRTSDGRPVHDTSFLIWLHAGAEPVQVTAPPAWTGRLTLLLRTDDLDNPLSAGLRQPAPDTLELPPHTAAILESTAARAASVAVPSHPR